MLTDIIQNIGKVVSINRYETLLKIQSYFSDSILKIASIALAGFSLTIAHFSENKTDETLAETMIIPHTYNHAILKYFCAGMRFEAEFDQSIKAIAS